MATGFVIRTTVVIGLCFTLLGCGAPYQPSDTSLDRTSWAGQFSFNEDAGINLGTPLPDNGMMTIVLLQQRSTRISGTWASAYRDVSKNQNGSLSSDGLGRYQGDAYDSLAFQLLGTGVPTQTALGV